MTTEKSHNVTFEMDLLDSLSAHVAVLDPDGTITQTNTAWTSFDDDCQISRAAVGTDYFNVLQQAVELGNDYALKQILGLKKVMSGDKDSFTLTYPLKSAHNTLWFKLTVRPTDPSHNHYIMINEDVSSSVEAKRKLEKQKSRYQVQFEQSMDGILITDTKGHVLDANPAASEILGWERENLVARTRDQIMDVSDPNYQSALQQRQQSGNYRLEMKLIHKDGRKVPVEIFSQAYRNKDGKMRAIVNFRDISHRKQVEQNLMKNKHFTESALNSIPGVFLVLDSQGNLVRWNDHMTTKLGYTAKELAHKNAIDFIIDDQQSRVEAKIQQCLQNGELSIETKVSAKNGDIKDYFLFAKRFEEEGETYMVGAGIDITEKKQVENENKKHQLMLQQLFDNAPVGITISDANNTVQQVNESFEKIFNYSQQEAVGQNINDLIVAEEKREEADAISQSTFQGNVLKTKSTRITKDNREVPVLIGGAPVTHNDETIAIYGIYVDISQQQQYQNKIEEALQEKEMLLAELHHRVKNNLALIVSLLEMQLFDSNSSKLSKELNSIKNRILTIASIHEVLYQNGNFNSIPFNNFLDHLFDSDTIQRENQQNLVALTTHEDELLLNINQSIPCGLLLNELLTLVFEYGNPDESTELHIRLREYHGQVHVILEGDHIFDNPSAVQKKSCVQNELIKILVMQLDAQLLWPHQESDTQKFELIFAKSNGHGPARKLLEEAE